MHTWMQEYSTGICFGGVCNMYIHRYVVFFLIFLLVCVCVSVFSVPIHECAKLVHVHMWLLDAYLPDQLIVFTPCYNTVC